MKAFIPSLTFLVAALCATSLLPNTAEAQSAVSNVHGVQKVTIAGASASFVSSPFVAAPVLTSRIASVSGSQITLEATLPTSVTLTGDYYVDVQSGTTLGHMTDIASVSGQTITCVDNLGSIGLAVGDTVSLRKIPTIGDIFGSDNKFGFVATVDGDYESGTSDVVFVQNASGALTPYLYFADLGGWIDGVGFESANNAKVYPESGIYLLLSGPAVSITWLGEVKQTKTNILVPEGASLLAIKNPLDPATTGTDRLLTLGNSGLYTGNDSTGIKPSPDGDYESGAGDVVFVQNASGALIPYIYYVDLGGWIDGVGFEPANDVVLKSGTGIYVLRANSAGAFEWKQPVNF